MAEMAQTCVGALDEADLVEEADLVDETAAADDDLPVETDAADELDETDDWTATSHRTHSNPPRSTALPTFQPAAAWPTANSATEAALCVALGAPFDFAALAFNEIAVLRRTSHAVAVQLREWGARCTTLKIDGRDRSLRNFNERTMRGLVTWFPKLVEGDERFTLKFVPLRSSRIARIRVIVRFDLPGLQALGGMSNVGDLELSGCSVHGSAQVMEALPEAVAVAISSLPRLSTFRAWAWREDQQSLVDELLTALHGKRPALTLNRGACDVCLAEPRVDVAVLPCSSETCGRSACRSHSYDCSICAGSKCRPCIVHTCSTCSLAICEECARDYPDQVPTFLTCSYCVDDDEDGRLKECSRCFENGEGEFWTCSADGCDQVCCSWCIDEGDIDVPRCHEYWNRQCYSRLQFCSDHMYNDGCPQCARLCHDCQPTDHCLSCNAFAALQARVTTLRTQIQSAGMTPLA